MLRRRQRGQSVIEFGIIAIVFTLIMFAIVDFGLLLNDWLTVSSDARLLARDAAVGMFHTELINEASNLKIAGVGPDPHFSSYCCAAAPPPTGSALQLIVVYYDQCTPPPPGSPGNCNPVDPTTLDSRYTSNGSPGLCTPKQNPNPPFQLIPCPHPSPPKPGACPPLPNCPGDSVVVTLKAAGAQVVTPLVRQVFELNAPANQCPDNSQPSRCYVPVGSTVIMRFEGDTL